jgi:hypothetical protein
MKPRVVILLGGMWLLAGLNASFASDLWMFGEGNRSCGAWIKEKSNQRVLTWVLGFVSGANAYQANRQYLSNKSDALAIFAWIDNYCRAHPLETVGKASTELVRALRRRAHLQ